MKLDSLRTTRTHRRARLDGPASAVFERFTQAMAAPHQIPSYAELRQQIHDDLRIQHPEWVQANGECPMCDSYEARLMEMLDTFKRTGSDESVADIRRTLEQELEGKQ